MLFGQSLFPLIQGFDDERLFSARGENFAIDIGGADAFDLADAQKTRGVAEGQKEIVVIFERAG